MPLLNLILAIIAGAITLVREVRKLVNDLSKKPLPYFIQASLPTPQIINHIPEVVSMEQVQIDMEKLFHKNQLHPRIKSEFIDSDVPFREHMVKNGLDPQFGFDLLVQMVLHKRAGLPILVGILRKHFKGNCQMTADAILKAAEIDLVDWNPATKVFIVKYDITPDVQEDLDRYQFPLPMIVEPRELRTNLDTGYFTSSGSVILKDNHHDNDVCLDHLNNMNKIKLTLNNNVASFIENSWRNLDKPKAGEERSDYNKRVRAFEKYDRTARDVMGHLDIAGGEFFLTHKVDKRGRTYCQGYHVNYQGNTWNKAVIEFANQELIDG